MKTVLIIENDPDTIELLETIVTGLNLNPVCVGEALDTSLVDKLNPDVILLDHWLDSSYGGDFCRELKTHPLTNHIPVIMMSAAPDLQKISQAAGADSYIGKPFQLEDIEAMVLQYLK